MYLQHARTRHSITLEHGRPSPSKPHINRFAFISLYSTALEPIVPQVYTISNALASRITFDPPGRDTALHSCGAALPVSTGYVVLHCAPDALVYILA